MSGASTPSQFLLISDGIQTQWSLILREALQPLGQLHHIAERGAVQHLHKYKYDVIIVDATVVADVPSLISHLREERPEVKIVVFTAAPTWNQAHAAFEAGVTDYTRKTWNEGNLQTILRDILALKQTPPPGRD